jgi:hypothetical protein
MRRTVRSGVAMLSGLVLTSCGSASVSESAGGAVRFPLFTWAGPDSTRIARYYVGPANAGTGTIVFAGGPTVSIKLTECKTDQPDFRGYGDGPDHERFGIELDRDQLSILTTRNPELVVEGTTPGWWSFEAPVRVDKRQMVLDDVWLFAVVGLNNGEMVNGLATAGTELSKRMPVDRLGTDQATMDAVVALLDRVAQEEAGQGRAVKVTRVTVNCG